MNFGTISAQYSRKTILTFCALIPAFNPGEIINDVINKTLHHVDHLILIDDGCDKNNAEYLMQHATDPKVTLITHPNNKGKGHAIHTGFAHFLTRREDYLIMLDSDGQHEPDEIKHFKTLTKENLSDFVIGVRGEQDKMPFKSKVGNKGMSNLFYLATGEKLKDTQSGFRLLSRDFVKTFINECPPGRYETEMKMLFLAAKTPKGIEQVPISTTYIDNNSNSKFRPIKDSFRVLSTFLKFTSVSIASFVVDFLIYLFLLSLNVNFLHAHMASRSLSGVFNFTLNREFVFKNKDSILKTSGKYLLAVLVSMAISSFLLWVLVTQLNGAETWSKPIAEVMSFILNFFVVKHFVFATTNADT